MIKSIFRINHFILINLLVYSFLFRWLERFFVTPIVINGFFDWVDLLDTTSSSSSSKPTVPVPGLVQFGLGFPSWHFELHWPLSLLHSEKSLDLQLNFFTHWPPAIEIVDIACLTDTIRSGISSTLKSVTKSVLVKLLKG